MKGKTEEEQKKYKEMDEGGEDTYDYGDSEEAVDTGAPKVASSKGSKIALIAFFAILISIVLYFAVFSGNKQSTQNGELQPVPAADFSVTTPTPEGNLEKFDDVFNKKDDPKEDVILETPDLPAVPELPNVFDDKENGALPLFMDLPPEEQKNAQNQQNGANNANNANNGGTGNGATNNSANQNVPEPPVVQPPPAPSPIIVVSGSPGPKTSVGYENNIMRLNKDPITSLPERVPSITAQYIKDRTVTLIQGKILTAILETAINTDFPGDVRGIISRDVFAESGTNILIPKGSRIYGTYSSTVTRGQARVTINWTRIIRPDGVDATIAFNAADQFGRSGIEGDVDNKYSAVIANSILTTVLAIGGVIAAEKLSDNGSNTTTTNAVNSTTTTSGSPSGQAIYDISKTVIDTVGSAVNNALNLNPTIRVPQGTKITIIVNNDMSLPQFKK